MAIWPLNDSMLVADFARKLGISFEHLDDMFMLQRCDSEVRGTGANVG